MLFSTNGASLPAAVDAWLRELGAPLVAVSSSDELLSMSLRGRPRLVVFDARGDDAVVASACKRLKSDSYTGIVPVVTVVDEHDEHLCAAFASGADEVLRPSVSPYEVRERLALLLRRSDRDVYVHPSTRLPGTVEIEAEIGRRMERRELMGVCYADLDHFKEFNDRYSYYDGDRVIRLLAKLLHDVTKGMCGERGFVGHIGGDDFIFIVPIESVSDTCEEIVSVFDLLSPYQYSEQDRRAGYFFGKDRRGQLHRVPLMTLSIGVVTNERRHFSTPAQVSELATEMKGYAKTLAGSVYTVDRRTDATVSGELTPPRAPRAISVIDES